VGRAMNAQARMTMFGCGRCGEALNLDLDLEDVRFAAMVAEGLQCRECRLAAPEFARAVAYASYDEELRKLIGLLKFERVRSVARLLGLQMAEAVLKLEGHAAMELLVIAVPLFKARERQRGYNQSVLLADEALGWLRRMRPDWKLVAAHKALVRVKSTESSFVLSRKGRRRNLAGAFKVIGDILTSGATARECARVLMRAGAAKVWVATLARAQKRFMTRQYDELHKDPGKLVARWDLAAPEPG